MRRQSLSLDVNKVIDIFFWLSGLKVISTAVIKYNNNSCYWVIFFWLALAIIFKMEIPLQKRNTFSNIKFNKILIFRLRSITLNFLVLLGILVLGAFFFPPDRWSTYIYLTHIDDWLRYENIAKQILNGDVFVLKHETGYVEMWSFSYPYFIAFIHFFLGDGILPIYFVHFILYIVIILCWYNILITHEGNNNFISFIFLLVGIFFLYTDLYRFYTTRLLSENISVILIVFLGFTIIKNYPLVIQGILCGLIYLNRLELITTGILLFLLHIIESFKEPRELNKVIHFFLLPFLLIILIYPLRNYFAYNEFRFFPISSTELTNFAMSGLRLLQKMIFNFRVILGECSLINTVWHVRYHWYVLHFALIILLFLYWQEKKNLSVPLIRMLVLLLSLIIPYLFASIGTYGFRYSLGMIFTELTLVIALIAKRTTNKEA